MLNGYMFIIMNVINSFLTLSSSRGNEFYTKYNTFNYSTNDTISPIPYIIMSLKEVKLIAPKIPYELRGDTMTYDVNKYKSLETVKLEDVLKKIEGFSVDPNGKISFLVNVRILVEGFDAPITKGVCFMHLPSNQTTLIQIIGRALRKYLNKTFANIILPFLKIMSLNDKRIKKSFVEKTIGGYISIYNSNKDEGEDDENFELKYNLIFDNMGKCLNGTEVWELKPGFTTLFKF